MMPLIESRADGTVVGPLMSELVTFPVGRALEPHLGEISNTWSSPKVSVEDLEDAQLRLVF